MKLTNTALSRLRYRKHNNGADLYFDDVLKGFGVRVYPSGRKSFFVSYRNSYGVKKRHTLGDFGSLTATGARQLAQRTLASVHYGRDPAAERRVNRQGLTFAELADRYLHQAADHKRSIKDDRQRLRDHLLPKLGSRKLSELRLQMLQQTHSDVRKKTSAATANRCAALLKRMLKVAIEWGQLEQSPATHLKLFREPPPRDIVLPPDECRRLIEACTQDENVFARSLFLLAMFTGRRIGELRKAKWADLNLEKGFLALRETKAGERQFAYLNATALTVLSDLPRVDGNPHIIAGSRKGQPLVHYRRAWDRILKRGGLKPFPPHGLRHNYASALVADGVPLDTVRQLLGHKSPLTTLKYAHHQPTELRRASQTFVNVIELDRY